MAVDADSSEARSDGERVAIVTGASSGIGQAIGLALAHDGYSVVAVGTNAERLADTRRQFEAATPPDAASTHDSVAADVRNEDDVARLFAGCIERYGHIDLLVASAGIGRKPGSTRVMPYPTDQLPLDEWSAVIDVNLTGIFLCNREAARVMGSQGRGHIINICSSTTPGGLRGTPYAPAYCASKFGVVGLTEALDKEIAPRGVRAQVVFPGPVTTPLVDDTTLAKPFGGSVTADHFAEAVVALAHQPGDAVVVHPHILPVRKTPAPGSPLQSMTDRDS